MEVINANLVNLAVDGACKEDIILELAKQIHGEDRLNSYDCYIQSVLDREALTTTGIGFGIAIPHGKCDSVKETTIAFGRTKEAIDWQSLDGEPTQAVFLLAVPEAHKGDEHLRIIASLSRKLIHEEFRERLFQSDSSEEIVTLISECIN